MTTSWQNPRIARQLSWFSSDVCLQKLHLLEFLVLQLGGILGNYHNWQLRLDTFQWSKMMDVCHGTLFFFLRCQIPGFFAPFIVKRCYFRLHLYEAFYLFKYLLFLLFLGCQVLDLELLLTLNLFCGMFAYHLFLIWHCSLEIP